MCWDSKCFFRLLLIHFNTTVYMWCVCYVYRMFDHCITCIMDFEPVNKPLS